MPITEDQIKFYLSGGSTNSDVFASIGGPMSTITQIRQDEFNNLWGDIGALDLKIGITQYRAVYLKNESNNTVFENPRAYFAIKDAYVAIQFTKLGVNKRVAQLVNERTAPPDAEVGPGGQIPAIRHTYPSANVTAIGYISGYPPAGANDQDITTGWIYSTAPAWFRVDMGATKNIDYVTIRWVRNSINASDSTFNIETSTDGTNWTTRFSGVHHLPAGTEGPYTNHVVALPPHSARYIRVNITASTNIIHEVGITEFEVWGVPDVSPTIEPSAVSETASLILFPSENVTAIGSIGGNIPANACDQNHGTGWLYSEAPAWLAVNLGATKYLHYVTLRWYRNSINASDTTYSVETSSDGASWNNVFSGVQHLPPGTAGPNVTHTVSFTRHNARHVRIFITASTNQIKEVGIAELGVWGVSEQLAVDVGGWEGATEDLATTQAASPHVPPLSYIGIWLRRVIPPNDVAFPTLKQTMKLAVVGGGGVLPPTAPPPPGDGGGGGGDGGGGEGCVPPGWLWPDPKVYTNNANGVAFGFPAGGAACGHDFYKSPNVTEVTRTLNPPDEDHWDVKVRKPNSQTWDFGDFDAQDNADAYRTYLLSCQKPPCEGGGGGTGGSGLGPYASTGKQLGSTTRRDTRHYASGKSDDETIEKNTKNIPYKHYQCVYYVTVHKVEHDDNVSSKLGGTHMGSGWHDHGVSFNSGKCCLGTEPNHPDTNSCIKVGANIGNIKEKRVGIATIWRKPTKHTELWTRLPGANWVKQLENTGALGGFTPNNSGDDEAQLRIDGFQDGSDPTIDTAIVQEIAPA